MKRSIAALALIAVAGAAEAQQVVDGSDAGLPAPTVAAARAILDAKYRTAGEYQLRRLKLGVRPTVVCGEMSAKESLGGFEGFAKMAVDTAAKVAEIVYATESTVGGDGRQASLRALNDVRTLCPADG